MWLAYHEEKEKQMKEFYLQNIQETYPDLQVSSVEYNHQGQNSDVLIINRDLILRFPKYPQTTHNDRGNNDNRT
jgi:hypothetical protein